MRRKRARAVDQSLALFEIMRLTYKFRALNIHPKEEARALEIMRVVMQYATFEFNQNVRDACISFVYETTDWLNRGIGSPDFVSHETTILMECAPFGLGGLAAPSRKPLNKRALDLFDHVINVSGEIAYAICKWVRTEETVEPAVQMLSSDLQFAVLNGLAERELTILKEFGNCERICHQRLREGRPFEAGLKLLALWKQEALSRKPG